MTEEQGAPDLTTLTAEIAASYVSHNRVSTGDIAGLIRSVHEALSGLSKAAPADEAEFPRAVSMRKSLANPDRIVSMIDGKSYTMLTRHLRTHGLTPDQYRQRYGLPTDYPMTAANYSEKRRVLAKALGLGRKAAQLVEPVIEVVEAVTKPKPGRRKAAGNGAAPAKRGRKPRAAAPAEG